MDLTRIADSAHSAIVVIDVQNDFCHPQGGQALMGMDVSAGQKMVDVLLKFLDRAHELKIPTIYVRNIQNAWTKSEAQLAKRKDRPALCEVGTFGADYYRVSPREGDYEIIKHRYSAFVGTDLDLVLRCRGIKTIVMTGVTTNTCVESTSRDGFMLEYNVIMLGDCVATQKPEEHEAALENIRQRFGYIATSDQLLDLWKKK